MSPWLQGQIGRLYRKMLYWRLEERILWCTLSVASCDMSSMERLLAVGAFFSDLWLARRLDFCRVANNNNIHKNILALCEFCRLRRSEYRTMLERH
jgi:hypothetical protein